MPAFQLLQRHYASGTVLGSHVHREAQLVYALSGAMRVETTAGRWLVPSMAAVWLPPLCPHAIEMNTDVTMFAIYYTPQICTCWCPGNWMEQVFALSVTALMRAIRTALSEGAEPERAALMAQLLLHEVARQPVAPTFLPLPNSEPARRAAALALADPACRQGLDALATQTASSPRTLSRYFHRETGLSYKTWRQRARIVAAVDMLMQGVPIKQIAERTGFAGPAAFSYAFRQVMGQTPAEFRGRHMQV